MSDHDIYVAKESFTCEVKGEPVIVNAGVTRVRAGHPLLEGREQLFEPTDLKIHHDIEQATNAPGQRRDTGRRPAAEKTSPDQPPAPAPEPQPEAPVPPAPAQAPPPSGAGPAIYRTWSLDALEGEVAKRKRTVTGTGPGGKVTKKDCIKVLEADDEARAEAAAEAAAQPEA